MRLSPLQGRILWALEEAGADDICTVVNTVQPQITCSIRKTLEPIAGELDELIQLGFITIRKSSASGSGFPCGARDVIDDLELQTQTGFWKWKNAAVPAPELVLEEAGRWALTH